MANTAIPRLLNSRENNLMDNDDLEFDDSAFQNDDVEYDDNAPLYEGAPITLGESMLSILTFVVRCNLTGVALSNLLKLTSLNCGTPNLLTTSLYLFQKYLGNMRSPLVKHYYCTSCHSPINSQNSHCEFCQEDSPVSYFIEVPIVNQLQTLFNRPNFYTNLQHRFHRKKKSDQNLEDIYDGEVYRDLSEHDGILSQPENISFTWNTHGVPLFKSSGCQLWPFYLTINELPYTERTNPDNILVPGLLFGPNKPVSHLFLQPFHSALNDIANGVYLNFPIKDEHVKVKGIFICGTCDLPAKALFLNITQFNGQYGCPKCKIHGKSVDRVWTYPFERDLNYRIDEETHVYAEEVLRNDAPVYGIKGPTTLSVFVNKFIRTTAVDAMHCVHLGVVKRLLTINFDPKYSSHPASLIDSIDIVDIRLSALKPPSFLQRQPCSIKEMKFWKANELKAWLFYYSLAILRDVMKPQYYQHYIFIVLEFSLFIKIAYLLKCWSMLIDY